MKEILDKKDKVEEPSPGSYDANFYGSFDHTMLNAKKRIVYSKYNMLDNRDRFGQSILPRIPEFTVPGPGEYYIDRGI